MQVLLKRGILRASFQVRLTAVRQRGCAATRDTGPAASSVFGGQGGPQPAAARTDGPKTSPAIRRPTPLSRTRWVGEPGLSQCSLPLRLQPQGRDPSLHIGSVYVQPGTLQELSNIAPL